MRTEYANRIFPSFRPNWLVRIPELVVPAEVYPNSYAQEILDPKHRYLASADFLRENCFLTSQYYKTDEENLGDVFVYAVPEWTRAVPLWGEMISYGDLIGGCLMVKGLGVSGRHFGLRHVMDRDDPWGFFGDRDALDEKEFGNQLLIHGGRSSLVTGYVVFENEDIMDLYKRDERLWGGHPDLREIYLEQIRKITRNGDRITIMHRIAGSRIRLDSNYTEDVHDKKRLLVDGARLWMAEYKNDPLGFRGGYFPEGVNSRTLEQCFESIADGRTMPLSEAQLFLSFVGGVMGNNLRALSRMFSPDNGQWRYRLPGIFEAKDVDSGLFVQDYENHRINSGGYKNTSNGGSFAEEFWVDDCLKDWRNQWLGDYLGKVCPHADYYYGKYNLVREKALAMVS